ncbi:MAG: hypothetical protein RLZZ435_3335 [Cyanobacteriota bacterium]|jgi:hypothetical protein
MPISLATVNETLFSMSQRLLESERRKKLLGHIQHENYSNSFFFFGQPII